MLFDKTVISGLEVKNRIIRSATHDGLADENGAPSDKLIDKYKSMRGTQFEFISLGLSRIEMDNFRDVDVDLYYLKKKFQNDQLILMGC